MGRTNITRHPSREGAEHLGDEVRGRLRRARPYIVGTASTAAVAGLEFLMAKTIGLTTTDAVVNIGIIATTMGGRAFKDVQRDSIKLTNTEKLGTSKIPRSMQMQIVQYGTFDEKSALLNNTHISQAALEMLKQDMGFRLEVLENLKRAFNDMDWCEKVIQTVPHVESYYKDIIRLIRTRIDKYENNLDMLDSETGSKSKRVVELLRSDQDSESVPAAVPVVAAVVAEC